jgi:hypothetical protein
LEKLHQLIDFAGFRDGLEKRSVHDRPPLSLTVGKRAVALLHSTP